MTDTHKYSVSVAGIVVTDRDRVLVIRRGDNGHWEPPGGVLEHDETFEEGIMREVQEETRMLVHVGNLTGVYKNMAQDIAALTFRSLPISADVKGADEAADVRWMTLPEIESVMAPVRAVRVTDSIRSHDRFNHSICLLHSRL
ncbi:NUDIX hydrolase [Crossiella sp. CA-258035]|uniref:NUDIX hydrolase n=1 Tax=Crossiella sp. CA-258035 TaxID=2981138 RepID=UPI0024BC07CB|nr:NUDIX hydrolase [Crossiella sp. CA-258035]WHT19806.1 NUDIX hydrolase [Crossiella sp. CA-258035]